MANLLNMEGIASFLPTNIADGMVKDVQSLSTVAKLSGRAPMRFGNTRVITFNDLPKAEFVGEGQDKSPTGGSFSHVEVVPHKAQVTMRFSEEVVWASEDYQLSVLDELANAGKEALSRALDLGLYHRINPLTGEVISSWTNYLTSTSNKVAVMTDTDADDVFRTAVGMVLHGEKPYQVTGAAFDPSFAWRLASLKTRDGSGPTSQQRYPQLGFGTSIESFMGVPVAVGNTVSGAPEVKEKTDVLAIVGDFRNGIRWGVQRELPLRLLTSGDPDGLGDLGRKNQIALRLEIVYGWYVFANKFAVITKGEGV